MLIDGWWHANANDRNCRQVCTLGSFEDTVRFVKFDCQRGIEEFSPYLDQVAHPPGNSNCPYFFRGIVTGSKQSISGIETGGFRRIPWSPFGFLWLIERNLTCLHMQFTSVLNHLDAPTEGRKLSTIVRCANRRSRKEAAPTAYPDVINTDLRLLKRMDNSEAFVEVKIIWISEPTSEGRYKLNYLTPDDTTVECELHPDDIMLFLINIR